MLRHQSSPVTEVNHTQTRKMKLVFVVALALVAVALAGPVENVPAQILESNFETQPQGDFEFSFKTDNKIEQVQTGTLKDVVDEKNNPLKVLVLRGSYSYVDNEGVPHSVTYVADENGYHAESSDIPTVAAQ